MTKVFQFIRRYPFSCLLFTIIWVLSLMPFFPETPLDDVQFIDKWTHLLMYGGACSVLWMEYIKSHRQPKEGKKGCAKNPPSVSPTISLPWRKDAGRLFLFAWLAPILMGGLLELLQAYVTTTRSGEWLDFAANSLGVTLGAVIGIILLKMKN